MGELTGDGVWSKGGVVVSEGRSGDDARAAWVRSTRLGGPTFERRVLHIARALLVVIL